MLPLRHNHKDLRVPMSCEHHDIVTQVFFFAFQQLKTYYYSPKSFSMLASLTQTTKMSIAVVRSSRLG